MVNSQILGNNYDLELYNAMSWFRKNERHVNKRSSGGVYFFQVINLINHFKTGMLQPLPIQVIFQFSVL